MSQIACCTYNTRLAGWMSALLATATFAFLHDTYDRVPIVIPISFESGNPLEFAIKAPALIYLPFGLQLALGAVFAAVVAVLVGHGRRADATADRQRRETAAHTAEGVALLAVVWIGFQAINAWRLTELWRRTFEPYMEMYVLALLTAFTVSVMIGVRVVMKVQEASSGPAPLNTAVLDARRPFASAGLAALLGMGIAAPIILLALVWDVLQRI